MDTLLNTLKRSALGLAIVALSAVSAGAQNYNNGYNDNSGYRNNGYNDNSGYRNNDNSYEDGEGDNDATYQDFYNALSPYGEWINDPDYGYVWVPDVGRDFRPYYTNGYWAQTEEYGNTWVSNYDWGWATFHYGRWTYDNSYGWVWIPGTEWAPAWVNWRSADDGYYGWAPMGPGYDVDYYSDNLDYYGPASWWVFAPQQYLYSNNFYNYTRAPRYNGDYLRHSRFIGVSQRSNGYRYFAGPRRRDLERSLGHSIPTFSIRNSSRPGGTRIVGGTGINMYRPRISAQVNIRNQQQRPQNFQQGRLNIIQGGGRQPGVRNNSGSGYQQSNNNGGRREQPVNVGERHNEQPGVQSGQDRRRQQMQQEQSRQQQQTMEQQRNQRVQQDQQVREQDQQRGRQQQLRQQDQQRIQQDQQRVRQDQQVREQQVQQQQRAQQDDQARQQRQQQMQQERAQRDQQVRQQETQRAQRDQQMQQQHAQEQRAQEQRTQEKAPEQRAQPQERQQQHVEEQRSAPQRTERSEGNEQQMRRR